MELSWDRWDGALNSVDAAFVMFTRDPYHCFECRRLTPHWHEMSEDYEESKHMLIASVDCSDQKHGGNKLCTKFGASGLGISDGLPEFRYFQSQDKVGVTWDGERQAKPLQRFAKYLSEACPINKIDSCTSEKQQELASFVDQDFARLKMGVEVHEKDVNYARVRVMLAKKMKKDMESDEKLTETARNMRLKEIEGRLSQGKEKLEMLERRSGHVYRLVRAAWLARVAKGEGEQPQPTPIPTTLKDEA